MTHPFGVVTGVRAMRLGLPLLLAYSGPVCQFNKTLLPPRGRQGVGARIHPIYGRLTLNYAARSALRLCRDRRTGVPRS